MRRTVTTIIVTAAGLAAAFAAFAGTTSKHLICAATEAQECAPNGACKRVLPGAINLPPMWHVDLEKKRLAAVTMEGAGRSEDIEGVKDGKKMIYLYGVQDEEPWSAVISRNTGAFTTTISADGNGFVIFGVCAPK